MNVLSQQHYLEYLLVLAKFLPWAQCCLQVNSLPSSWTVLWSVSEVSEEVHPKRHKGGLMPTSWSGNYQVERSNGHNLSRSWTPGNLRNGYCCYYIH